MRALFRIRLEKTDVAALACLAAVFVIAALIVHPAGDFPLNDDWSFATAVRRLARLHAWRPLGWSSMPLISQSVWALPACALTDCSFEVLRGTTMLAGFVLLVSSFGLFRIAGGPTRLSLAAALTVSLNVVTFALTYTFMTDVVFEMLLVLAALFCVRALRTQAGCDVAVAAGLTVAATLCRQLAPCVGIAFCVVYAMVSREPAWRRAGKAAAPLLASVLALVAYETWMRNTGRLPALYDQKTVAIEEHLSLHADAVKQMFHRALDSVGYLGLFTLPVSLCIGVRVPDGNGRPIAWRAGLIACGAGGMVAAELATQSLLMPLSGHILVRQGIGPLTIRGATTPDPAGVPSLPAWFWLGVGGLCIVGSALLCFHASRFVARCVRRQRRRTLTADDAVGAFAVISVAAYLAPVIAAGFFDRYMAAIVPLTCLLLVAMWPRQAPALRRMAGGFVLCGGMALFAVLATHDYLSWNRARWRAIHDLEASGQADARTLDGGFEYGGLRSYDPEYVARPPKSRWWVAEDKYVITFAPLPGLRMIGRYGYANYLPVATRYVYVMERGG